jgi:nitrite reductase/ring-hydroxylating ferredoxin subunit
MAHDAGELQGPDFGKGVPSGGLVDGVPILGHAGGEAVALVRTGPAFFAVGVTCTHYATSLAGGIVADGMLRCPLHHACFDLATGEALRAPAFAPVASYAVEVRDGRVRVGERRPEPAVRARAAEGPASVVIVGAGAAAYAAANVLVREGFRGTVTLLGTLAGGKAGIAGARKAKRAVVVGAGFIGLEAAASRWTSSRRLLLSKRSSGRRSARS